ncbi:MAG: NAD(P)H-dependent glycerol-3-phosphate dehydrogenase, partial [Eubacteriales bacterium]
MNITVLGSGAWGTALALVLVENGHQVTIWSYLKAQADEMKKTGINPALSGITLPKNLGITDDISVVRESGCVVIATPSFAVRETARRLKGLIPDNTVIISVAKGIEASTSLRMSQMIEEELPSCPVVVLTGPSHAEEVGRGIPTGVLVAADHPVHSQLAQDLFMNTRFRVYTSEDKIGSEICAALKNVMAVCSGCSDGLGYGDNTKAMLMTRGLAEMGRLGVALGAKRETFGGLAGVGDLIVTCTSMHSRNRRFGILVGEG